MVTFPDGTPEIIRDLFHNQVNRRRTALSQLSRDWNIKFREYLWKAIEDEYNRKDTNRDLQKQMVDLAIDKLEAESLRKMIRFIEKGELFSPSILSVVNAYIHYENEEIRNALLKSLLRENSLTKTFVVRLIASDRLIELERSRLNSLILDLLKPIIPTNDRKKFITAIMEKYYSAAGLRSVLEDLNLWKVIQKDEVLAIQVLEVFFHQKSSKNHPDLIWEKWDWSDYSDEIYVNPVTEILTPSEKILLELTSSKYTRVRRICIRILQHQQKKFIPSELAYWLEKGRSAEIYWENFYLILDKIMENQIVDEFLFLPDFHPDTLEQLFSSYPDILVEMKTLNINPSDLSAFMLAYLPRYYIYRLLNNDPDDDNRELAYSLLCSEPIWIDITTSRAIGPYQQWLKVVMECTRGIRFEIKESIHTSATILLFNLIDMIEKINSEFGQNIRDLLEKQINLKILNKIDRAFPIKYKLNLFIHGQTPIFPNSLNMPSAMNKILIKEFVRDLTSSIDVDSMMNMVLRLDVDDRLFLIEHLLKKIKSKDYISSVEGSLMKKFLKQLQDDEDVRVRTKSHLLAKRLSIK